VSSESATALGVRARPTGVLVLAILGLLTFALVPVRVNTIYDGLPAHPLFLHVPVVLIPVAGLAALVLAVRPGLLERHGVWVAGVAVAALGATNLTIGSGKALEADLLRSVGGIAGTGGEISLIHRHQHAADILRLLLIAFTAMLILTLALWRASASERVSGIGPVDAILRRARAAMPRLLAARLALGALALACLYYVFRTGDLGAKAVWQGRIPTGHRLIGPLRGLPGSLFPPGVHPPGAPGSPGASTAPGS